MRAIITTWTLFACLAIGTLPASAAAPADRAASGVKDGPLTRVRELLGWVAREQHDNGGWAHRAWLPIRFHLHASAGRPSKPPKWPANPFDTAMAGLALVRGRSTLEDGAHGKDVTEAAEYLYAAVMSSPDGVVGVAPETKATPFTDRIGPHADAFAALIFFAELRARSRDADGGLSPAWVRYEQASDKLIHKITHGLRPDGSWGDGAAHAPLLGHALGVWALEAASREGMAVDPAVVARAGQFAMSKEAEKREFKRNGRWRKSTRAPRPGWMKNEVMDDDEPVMHETYLMAARLCVLYQADRSNRLLLDRETARAKAGGAAASPGRLANLTAMTRAANGTRKALAEAGDAIRRSWSKAHERDAQPCPAPQLFTGEDFLASLLTVDAMARSGDVERWFPPVVQELMSMQDADGGLRIQNHISCQSGIGGFCRCMRAGPTAGDARRRKVKTVDEFAYETQNCPMQKSWCARDRTFMTSAGICILLADTPYRSAFVGEVKP